MARITRRFGAKFVSCLLVRALHFQSTVTSNNPLLLAGTRNHDAPRDFEHTCCLALQYLLLQLFIIHDAVVLAVQFEFDKSVVLSCGIQKMG